MNDPARLVRSASLFEVVPTTVHVASTDERDVVAASQVVHGAFAPHDPPGPLLGVMTLGHPGPPARSTPSPLHRLSPSSRGHPPRSSVWRA